MLLIDTSIWVELFRQKSEAREQKFKQALAETIGTHCYYLPRFSQTELLQGAKDETEWAKLYNYLKNQNYVDPTGATWVDAARIYYELRRQGITVRNTIDCLIAASAIERELLLLHIDRDFEAIATGTKLREFKLIY